MVIAGLNCYDRTLDTPNKSLNLKLSLWRNLRTRCAFESDGVCWKPNPYLEFFVSASPLLYKKRRSHISLFPSQLFLPFFWYIFVLKTLAWRGKKQSDIRDRREAGKFCVKRRRKWDTQRFGTRIPRALGLAPAPGMHRFLCPLFRFLFPFDHSRPFRAIDDVLLGCEVVEDVLVIREFLEDFRLRAFWVSVARLTLRSKLLYVCYYFTCPKVPLCFAHLFSLSRLTFSKGFHQQMGSF
jgi:hypothetical protein